MATIYLVRHGKAAAGFGGHADPGLDELGRAQAEATAAMLAPLGPLTVYSSPLARARETAEPLAGRWSTEIHIESRVAEIPSPTEDLTERASWLRRAMAGRWSDLDERWQAWRRDLVGWVSSIPADAVIFSHFVAINALVGAARDDDTMVVFSPDNASVTTLTNDNGRLQIQSLGRTAETQVN